MTAIAAILLACTHGDRDTAAAIHAAAVHAGVDPAIALAVACVESGLSAKSANPLGVRACYRRVSDRPTVAECIRIGVVSLRNRLRGCGDNQTLAVGAHGRDKIRDRPAAGRGRAAALPGTTAASAATVVNATPADKIEACALRRYQGGTRPNYPARVLRIARFVRAKGATDVGD